MKLYYGYRVPGRESDVRVTTLAADAASRLGDDRSAHDSYPLPLREDLRQHSDSFEWGYGGSGPAQLALALCCDVLVGAAPFNQRAVKLADERALRVYQNFKFAVVGRLTPSWELTEEQVLEAIQKCERKMAALAARRDDHL